MSYYTFYNVKNDHNIYNNVAETNERNPLSNERKATAKQRNPLSNERKATAKQPQSNRKATERKRTQK